MTQKPSVNEWHEKALGEAQKRAQYRSVKMKSQVLILCLFTMQTERFFLNSDWNKVESRMADVVQQDLRILINLICLHFPHTATEGTSSVYPPQWALHQHSGEENLFWRFLIFALILVPFYFFAFTLEFSTAALGRHEGLQKQLWNWLSDNRKGNARPMSQWQISSWIRTQGQTSILLSGPAARGLLGLWSPDEVSSEIRGMYITSYSQYTLPWAGSAAGFLPLWNLIRKQGALVVAQTLLHLLCFDLRRLPGGWSSRTLSAWSGSWHQLPSLPACKCFPVSLTLKAEGSVVWWSEKWSQWSLKE